MAENLQALSDVELVDALMHVMACRPDANAPKEFLDAMVVAEDAKTELVRRLALKKPEPPTITVERGRVPLDPAVDVFHVRLETKDGGWDESFGSEIETRAFLLGVVAGSQMLGAMNVVEPDIPTEPTTVFSSELSPPDVSADIEEIPF